MTIRRGSDHEATTNVIAGYCSPQSARPGERVELFCSTSAPVFDVEVVRQGLRDELVWSASGVSGAEHPIPEDVGSAGCRWPAALSIEIPDDWQTGFYLVRLRAAGETAEAFFVVRVARPGDALLVLSSSPAWTGHSSCA